MTTKFRPGQVVSTPAALDTFDAPFMAHCLARHLCGDWGDVDAEDRASNDATLTGGDRLLSVYNRGSDTLWIITEHDRSVTTLLLPSDY